MDRKSSTLSLRSVNSMGNSQALKAISTIILALSVLALAVAAVFVAMPVLERGVSPATVTGLDASGETYRGAYSEARARAADAARWSALGGYYNGVSLGSEPRARAAEAARWTALGDAYQSKIEAGDASASLRPRQAGEYEANATADGKDLDLAALHARNFADLLAREADEVVATPSDLERAELHARNFADLLAREADEAAAAAPDLERAELHARNFADLLAREADEVAAAAPDLEIAELHARNFAFVDHELRFAGGYTLSAPANRDSGFDFVDHELMYAGGYGLVAPAERGAGFDFVDHELMYAGGYGLVAPAQKVSASPAH